jgi:hypothetical protein
MSDNLSPNEHRIRLEFKSYGAINEGCGGCLSYEPIGADKDPLCKSQQAELNTYGHCLKDQTEVYSNEICQNFATIPGMPTKKYRNRKEPRTPVKNQPNTNYLQPPKRINHAI